MTKYIYAKIDRGNRLASRYLTGNSEVNYTAIPIYFDGDYDNEEDFLKYGGAKNQGALFFECGRHPDEKYIVVLCDAVVHIMKPIGPVTFEKSTVHEEHPAYVKLLPVEILKKISISEVPMILASISANRYYSSGTFREISDIGNIRALQISLGKDISIPNEPSIVNALECLSSVEFETLVAKIFEEAGLFVPAYRGGMMHGADLFAYNKSMNSKSVGRITIGSGSRISIQVKLRAHSQRPPAGVDYLVTCNALESDNTLGSLWLSEALSKSPITKAWLISSLDWLPTEFVQKILIESPPNIPT